MAPPIFGTVTLSYLDLALIVSFTASAAMSLMSKRTAEGYGAAAEAAKENYVRTRIVMELREIAEDHGYTDEADRRVEHVIEDALADIEIIERKNNARTPVSRVTDRVKTLLPMFETPVPDGVFTGKCPECSAQVSHLNPKPDKTIECDKCGWEATIADVERV